MKPGPNKGKRFWLCSLWVHLLLYSAVVNADEGSDLLVLGTIWGDLRDQGKM